MSASEPPSSTPRRRWDDYLVPNSAVRGNNLGYTDPDELAYVDSYLSTWRGAEILNGQVTFSGEFDLDHYLAIHAHLFSDVYPTAGKVRDTVLYRGGGRYAAPADIAPLFAALRRRIRDRDWTLLSLHQRVVELAGVYAELNAISPAHQGNGRTQRLFVRELAATVGVDFDLAMLEREAVTTAAVAAAEGDLAPTVALLAGSCAPSDGAAPPARSSHPSTPKHLVWEVFAYTPGTLTVAQRTAALRARASRRGRPSMFDDDPTQIRGPDRRGPHIG